jgi:hypothetical protein
VSDGFQVVMSDLQTAAGVFGAESKTLAAVMPIGGPVGPDGGSAAFDGALRTVTEALGALNAQLSDVIAQHGRKLQTAHDNYQHAEISLTQLSQELTSSLGGGS